jgi:hypothetical protein
MIPISKGWGVFFIQEIDNNDEIVNQGKENERMEITRKWSNSLNTPCGFPSPIV